MQKRRTAISILFLTVIVSGCIGPNSSTEAVSGQALTVSGPDIQPSSGEVVEGSTVQVSLGIENTGETNATLLVGDNGEEILTDHCPDIFDITSFDARSSNVESPQPSYNLEPGWEARFDWQLEATVSPGLIDDRCDLSFQAPFNYSVDSFRELQIKRDSEVGTADLSSKSSRGPVNVEIETQGETTDQASVFQEGNDIEALIRFRKKTDGEGNPYKGLIDIRDPEISVSNNLDIDDANCEIPDSITMYQSTSQIVRCGILYGDDGDQELDSPSTVGSVSASTNYRYTKDAGTATVTVISRGQ